MNGLATLLFWTRRFVLRTTLMVPVLLLFALSCSGEQSPTSTGKVFEEVLEPVVTEVPVAGQEAPSGGARRLILVIGDGMGAEQIRAASLYKTGREEGLVLQSLPVYADMATHNASHEVPDSAAAGTAMATAIKVQNGVVGVRLPGEGEDLPSITEQLSDKGWKVGLVTTAHTTHATPAAFGAHVASRLDYDGIARDYLTVSRPHIILGGGGYGMDPETVVEAGYTVVTSREELSSMVSHRSPGYRIAGLFGEGHLPYLYDGRPADLPGLVEMSAGAVEFLAATEDDFFLMIEAARIDHAGHANDIERLIPEVLELDAVVEMLLNHPLLQEDTLLVVTADHETGGLSVNDLSEAGTIPEVSWATICHTAVDVPLFAGGVGAERFAGVFDNTLLHGAMCAALEPDSDVWLAIGSTIPSEEVTAQ